jgi:tetratricopeptide (TPR) repeat protein
MLRVDSHSRWNMIVGAAVFVVVLSCYLVVISPTVSFWDSGEFIATSYSLGVPHPPGTPFYVIVGRLFAMLPFHEKALGVNLMSALTGALASLFLYLITVRILVLWRGLPRSRREKAIIYCCGACAALAGAFGSSHWTDSIEAEVYSPAALIMAFTVWLMVRWAHRYREDGSRNSLVLICYLLGLSVGLHLGTVLVLPAFVLFALVVDYRIFTDVKFIVLVVFVGLLGLSNHLFLPIRSALNPAIDEANPERWDAFRDCLLRRQYKPMTPFIRQAPWDFQFGMFWRYFREQWTGNGGSWTILLMLAGAFGAFVHFLKQKRTFVLMATLFLITSLGLIVYMNFTDHEVRERDYFFAHGFFFFSVWIGLAFAYLADLSGRRSRSVWLTPLVLAGLLAFTFSSYYVNFESHDRRGDWNAHDYGYNMLATVAPNGLIFTNGDNDTFPLWFIQEVKGFRKDVRVVNLSLLNTPWYIWQLKHLEPQVPMRFTDKEIAALKPYRDRDGRIVMVKDIAAKEIVEASQGKRPVYFAVTVADYMGFDPHLKLEGLAFRYYPENVTESVDVDKTLYNLYTVYRYRGLLEPVSGGPARAPEFGDVELGGVLDSVDLTTQYRHDTKVYKDINTRRLVTNYAAAHLKLCVYYLQTGEFDKAKRELERAALVSPGYDNYKEIAVATYGYSGEVAKAESLANSFIARDPRNVNIYLQLFRVYRRAGMLTDAENTITRLIKTLPDEPDGYSVLASFYEEQGFPGKAADVVRQWVDRHPSDKSAISLLRSLEAKAAGN